MTRTIKQIGEQYDRERQARLQKIRDRVVSASMSGIEYMPRPWNDLDLDDDGDLSIISAWMAPITLRKLTSAELEIENRKRALFMQKMGADRDEKMAALGQEEFELRVCLLKRCGYL